MFSSSIVAAIYVAGVRCGPCGAIAGTYTTTAPICLHGEYRDGYAISPFQSTNIRICFFLSKTDDGDTSWQHCISSPLCSKEVDYKRFLVL